VFAARVVVTDTYSDVSFPFRLRIVVGDSERELPNEEKRGAQPVRAPELAKAFEHEIGRLGDRDAAVRREAIRRVNRIVYQVPLRKLDAAPVDSDLKEALRKTMQSAVPKLAAALGDEDGFVREQAAMLLRWAGPDANAAVPKLADVLRKKDPPDSMRFAILSTFARLGPVAEAGTDAVLDVVNLRGDERRELRLEAVKTLSKIARKKPGIVPALTKLLDHEDWMVRGYAALVLGELRAKAAPAIPKLVERLKAVVPMEPALLAYHYRNAVIGAFRDLGPQAKDAVPDLVKLLECKDVAYQGYPNSPAVGYAIEALGNMGPAAQDAVPVLTEYAKDGGSKHGALAADALRRIQN
jgi:HEAT repeat protein